MHELSVLDRSGHLRLTWDPNAAEEVENAREEVERLRQAGYGFFLVESGIPADPVTAGNGALEVRRVDDPIAAMREADEAEPVLGAAAAEEPLVEEPDDPEPAVDHRRGEWRAWNRRR